MDADAARPRGPDGDVDGGPLAEGDGAAGAEAEGGAEDAEPAPEETLNHFLDENRRPMNERPEIRANELRAQRRAVAQQRTELSRQIRNETRKRKRMLQKSALMSTLDLVAVLELRSERQVAAKAKAKAKARAADNDID
jgi:hypothetical protein